MERNVNHQASHFQ